MRFSIKAIKAALLVLGCTFVLWLGAFISVVLVLWLVDRDVPSEVLVFAGFLCTAHFIALGVFLALVAALLTIKGWAWLRERRIAFSSDAKVCGGLLLCFFGLSSAVEMGVLKSKVVGAGACVIALLVAIGVLVLMRRRRGWRWAKPGPVEVLFAALFGLCAPASVLAIEYLWFQWRAGDAEIYGVGAILLACVFLAAYALGLVTLKREEFDAQCSAGRSGY